MYSPLPIFSLALLALISFQYPHEIGATNLEKTVKDNIHSDLHCPTSNEKDPISLETFIAALDRRIEELTLSIIALEQVDDFASLRVFNERGVAYFFKGDFENALQDFNFVLVKLQTRQIVEREIMGTALWGRLFCHAFQSQLQETYNDCEMIQLFSSGSPCAENNAKNHIYNPVLNPSDEYFILPVAKFAYPDEKISRSECRDRVINTADKMRSIVEFIPQYFIKQAILSIINNEVENSLECCARGQHWTNCVGPIADGWKTLENTWDRIADLYYHEFDFKKFLFEK